jgi:hypothetical protein
MSRGYGWVQRRIIEVLEAAASADGHPLTASQLTEQVFTAPIEEDSSWDWLKQMVAREESVKRALRKLRSDGVVTEGRIFAREVGLRSGFVQTWWPAS